MTLVQGRFQNKTQKTQIINEKVDIFDFLEIKNFSASKTPKTKRKDKLQLGEYNSSTYSQWRISIQTT